MKYLNGGNNNSRIYAKRVCSGFSVCSFAYPVDIPAVQAIPLTAYRPIYSVFPTVSSYDALRLDLLKHSTLENINCFSFSRNYNRLDSYQHN